MNLPTKETFNHYGYLKPKYWEDRPYLLNLINEFLLIKYKQLPASFDYQIVLETIEIYNINWN